MDLLVKVGHPTRNDPVYPCTLLTSAGTNIPLLNWFLEVMLHHSFIRSITLEYTKDVKSDNGLTFYRYEGTESMFASYVENPDNWCFSCVEGYCHPYSGALNSSTCRFGAPAFVSFPHYYRADSFYQNQVEGLNPDAELHRLHIDLEPRTSIPLKASGRFQINIQVQPIEGLECVI